MARADPRVAPRAPLTWSSDRAEVFARCPRERWFERRAARADPLGRAPGAGDAAEGVSAGARDRGDGEPRLRVHRCLITLEALTGRSVRAAVRRERHRCRGTEAWSPERLIRDARAELHAGWRQSATGAWKTCPGRAVHLDEHHYQTPVSREDARAMRKRIAVAGHHACRMEALAPLREAGPSRWRSSGEPETFAFEGALVADAPHLAYDDGGWLHLWDLVFGRVGERELFALHVHAVLARRAWGADPERLRLHVADLSTGQAQSTSVLPARLAEVEARMTASIRAMDAARLASRRAVPDPRADPPDGAPTHCPTCRFRGVCDAAAER